MFVSLETGDGRRANGPLHFNSEFTLSVYLFCLISWVKRTVPPLENNALSNYLRRKFASRLTINNFLLFCQQ